MLFSRARLRPKLLLLEVGWMSQQEDGRALLSMLAEIGARGGRIEGASLVAVGRLLAQVGRLTGLLLLLRAGVGVARVVGGIRVNVADKLMCPRLFASVD